MPSNVIDLTVQSSPPAISQHRRQQPALVTKICPPPTTEALHIAIDIAHVDRLRTVLKDIIRKHPPSVDWIGAELLASDEQVKPWLEGEEAEVNSEDEKDEEDEKEGSSRPRVSADASGMGSTGSASYYQAPSQGTKRSVCRFATCENCNEEYDTTVNEYGDCAWHDGELEVDYDADIWTDHDENCHGRIDTDDMREGYPEGFKWNCCDTTGEAEGCKVGMHLDNNEALRKRAKY